MSLLAGLSQQASALTAHNDDATAHMIPHRTTVRWENVTNALITGSGTTGGSLGMQIGVRSGDGGGTIARRMAADYMPIFRGGNAYGSLPGECLISVVAVRETSVADGLFVFSWGLKATDAFNDNKWFGWYSYAGMIGLRYFDGTNDVLRPTVAAAGVSGRLITVQRTESEIILFVDGQEVDRASVPIFPISNYCAGGVYVSSATGDERWRLSALEITI